MADNENVSKYKLHLRYGREGLSEHRETPKRIRIQKMYKESQGDESYNNSTPGGSNVIPETNARLSTANDDQAEFVEQDGDSRHLQSNEVLAARLLKIQKSSQLMEEEDLLCYRDGYLHEESNNDNETEHEALEIEEESNDTDVFQELMDKLEYMAECTETENEDKNKAEKLFDDPKFYESMKKCVDRSPAEALLMILTFSLHAKLAMSNISLLVKMFNAFLGDRVIPDSKYMLDKIFNNIDHCEFHAVCPDCSIYVGKLSNEQDSVTCEICGKKMDLSNPSCLNFFLIIDPSIYVADYLQQNEDYYTDVLNGKYGRNLHIKDIYDGQLYKDFLNSLSEEDRKNYATTIFNTDGAPRFESSLFSIWPIYLQINELPPQERLRCAIPTALYFGAKKPDMGIFLKPFVDMMNKKSSDGLKVTIKGEERLVKMYTLVACADAVARAPMQGIKQFNGYYGCSWCKHEGKYDGSMRYPILNFPEPELRNPESMEDDADRATNSGQCVDGVKYASPLLNLDYFHIVRGFAPDYMHFYLIGTASQFTDYYIETLSKENLEILDRIMMSFAVPNQICRLSKPLSQRHHWKAKEWENWVLYYSLPILQLILTERALKHWALLVDSLHILLSTEIPLEKLNLAHSNLVEFVKEAERIFTYLALTSNVHQLVHVCQSVYDWGPVWAHSNFVFESANAILLKAIHCANGVNLQIMRFINLQHNVRILKNRVYPNSDGAIKRYCEEVEFSRVQKTVKISNVRYFGKEKNVETEHLEKFNLSALKIRAFSKIVKDGTMYSVKLNKRSCNSYIQLNDGRFVKCLNFIVDAESKMEVMLCHSVRTSKFVFSENILEVTSITNEVEIVETADIKKVCVYLKIGKSAYVCPVVNALYY